MYPAPAFVYLIEVTCPLLLIVALPIAVVPTEGALNVTVGSTGYPFPTLIIFGFPKESLVNIEVAAAPVPKTFWLLIIILGGTV